MLTTYKIFSFLKKYKRLMNHIEKIKSSYEWSGLLRGWIAVYFELSFASFLQVLVLTFNTWKNVVSSILGCLVFLANCSLPFIIYKL